MPNLFTEKPKLAKPFPETADAWQCDVTGLWVPKDPDANLKYRADLLREAEDDPGLQDALYTAASQSLLYFINTFVFTLRVFESKAPVEGETRQAEHSHLPFVTWDIQDDHLLRIEDAIETGYDLLTDKSRDMGATWDHIAVLAHRFLFRSNESHLMISRKEDAVDELNGFPKDYPHGPVGSPGTLFGKIDYILRWLPEWMLPSAGRKRLHLVNHDNGSRIDGESANASAGSSDRRTSIFLDEMAKMTEGEAIKRSTRDVTACRLACSTPNGAGTAYSKWRLSGQVAVFVLPWWEHPEKGAGRYLVQDDLKRWCIRSPWYDHEASVRSPKELAIEVDMDHVGSGDLFFESHLIEEHRKLFARKPGRMLGLEWEEEWATDKQIVRAVQRRMHQAVRVIRGPSFRLWAPLENGRLSQSHSYTVGCDISKGMGASNSTISVVCNETKEKVLAYADANTPPYEFARLVVALCVWIGGRGGLPLLIWENNGDPGFDFGRQIVKVFRYPRIYYERRAGTAAEKKGKRYGWRSSPEQKAVGLGMLRRAYAHGGIRNRDDLALDEALTYVHFEGGGIGPAELVEESAAARATHGDRVIADMLCVVGMDSAPALKRPPRQADMNTFAGRMKQWKKRQKQQKTQRVAARAVSDRTHLLRGVR
jgi:hypothetical protein